MDDGLTERGPETPPMAEHAGRVSVRLTLGQKKLLEILLRSGLYGPTLESTIHALLAVRLTELTDVLIKPIGPAAEGFGIEEEQP